MILSTCRLMGNRIHIFNLDRKNKDLILIISSC